MTWHDFIFGRLSWDAFPHNAVNWGGAIFMVVMALFVLAVITYKGWWGILWRDWLTSLDHKKIGVLYIGVALVMLVRGASDAFIIRTQQVLSAGSSAGIISAQHFQEIFSAHGTIMIFFAAMGLLFGIVNLVLPLMIGSRDVAFPFLNSLSLWFFITGAVLVNLSLLYGDFSSAGWLAYPPLSELAYSPTTGVDYWLWSLQISGIGSLLSGVNFIATIVKKRAPGMTYFRLPMFVWTVGGAMALVIFSFPILTVTLSLLALDRTIGAHFFTAAAGGNMMMYVNLIWAWGHPEVYILVLPAYGVFSEIVPVFSGKKLAGYTSMVFSVVGIAFFSFIVWLHHFFTMGAGADVNAFFGIMTMIIAIPTGAKIFNWIATMYRGRIRFTSPMYWFMGFVCLFTLGGVTGVMLAQPAADYQLHNSLFLVAHFHTMIISGVLFGFFAGLTFWFPKIFGFMLDEKWGIRAFWLWTWGFILAFGPLYLLGFMGATRRLDHYAAGLGWQPLFIVAAIGAVAIGLGFICQLIQLYVSIRDRKLHPDLTGDPWNGRSLEWALPSPPPAYNFAVIPTVHGRDEWWAMKQSGREEPAHHEEFTMPRNTPLGMFIAAGAFCVGFGFVWHLWWLVALGIIGGIMVAFIRVFDEDTEDIISVGALERMEAKRMAV